MASTTTPQPQFPIAGLASDGYSTDSEATAVRDREPVRHERGH
jgi:hypothetical protein